MVRRRVASSSFSSSSSSSSPADAVKQNILDTLSPFVRADGQSALDVPEDVRRGLSGLCRSLESANPNPEPATTQAQAQEGTWRVRFSDAPPPSNGQLGPFAGEAFQIIDVEKQCYENLLSLGGGAVEVSLLADWKVNGPAEWRVAFRSIQFRALGFRFPRIRFPEGTERTWCLTYVDDDTRVVRAGVDGGNSVSRNLGLIGGGEGEAKDAYLFYMTKEKEGQ